MVREYFEEDYETEVWNLAKPFPVEMVLFPLIEINELFVICRNGTRNLPDELVMSDNIRNKSRMSALKRASEKEKEILDSTESILIQRKVKKENIEKIREKIEKARKLINKISYFEEDVQNHNEDFIIKEKFFEMTINLLEEIKTDLVSVLNIAGLIFKEDSAIDLKALAKERFRHGG